VSSSATRTRHRLGIDIGGTFTDAIIIDEQTGEVQIAKVLTTPDDPSAGFAEASQRARDEARAAPEEVGYLVHATTVATNAIIEGKAAPTGFITTDGFRDMLEIARQIRPSLYDLRFVKPQPLVPRHHSLGVRERIGADGEVVLPIELDDVREAATYLRDQGVQSIAVCFLHSYLNPDHERRAADVLRSLLPNIPLSISSEVAPEFREYLRASTTIINAAVQPIVASYLEGIESRLGDEGMQTRLLVMQSSGGVYTSAAAKSNPVFMVESGPAAGVIAAAYLGETVGHCNVLSFDMGGTTAKVGLIRDGAPSIARDYELGASAGATLGEGRGSGYPIRTPVIDLVEIGAGGGSIAWIDSGGALRVGPQSAGADPGPACYGRGGSAPTVTDANLVLGRLNPDYFLGGEIELDASAAWGAVDEACATPLGLETVLAANAIVEIANAAMVNAIRLVSIQRGYDPRDFVLIAFGGAGPAHANQLAAANEIATLLIPPSPGIASALGLLVTDLKRDYSATLIGRLDEAHASSLEDAFTTLEAQGLEDLAREGLERDEIDFVRQLDLRYVGQGYELTLATDGVDLAKAGFDELTNSFHLEHERAYGHAAPEEPVEFVSVRVAAIGRIEKPRPRDAVTAEDTSGALKATREVYFRSAGGFVECPVYDRYQLAKDAAVDGPAIVEEFDSTTVIHPDYRAIVDRYSNLIVTPIQESAP
jgi:N-methylhydantoinase A